MDKKGNKYFILIWTTIVIGYNSILFLLATSFNKELFRTPVFWLLYGWMMISFLIWLFVGVFETGFLKFSTTFIYPYLINVFLLTTILYFYAIKIEKVAFIIVPMIFFLVVLILVMILGIANKKVIQQNTQQLKEIKKVEELYTYFMGISKNCDGEFKTILDSLAVKCQNLTSNDDEDTRKLDQRLIEYATFIKKNAINKEINIENNVKQFEEILEKRAK